MGTKADYETLATLLATLFPSAASFRGFLETWYPTLAASLPQGPVNMVDLLHDSVRLLDRVALIDEAFFRLLNNAFQEHGKEINALSLAWRAGREAPRKRIDSSPPPSRSLVRNSPSKTKLTCGLITATPAQQAQLWAAVAPHLHDWNVREIANAASDPVMADRLYTDPMILVDVSGFPPGVMFALGLRVGLGKPVVLVKDDTTKIPFNSASLEYVTYSAAFDFPMAAEFGMYLNRAMARALAPGSETYFLQTLEQLRGPHQPAPSPQGIALEKRLKDLEEPTMELERRVNRLEAKLTHLKRVSMIVSASIESPIPVEGLPAGMERERETMVRVLIAAGATTELAERYASDATLQLGTGAPIANVRKWLQLRTGFG